MRIRLADVEPSPDAFAAVMASGVLSIAAGMHHYTAISETLGVLASVGLLVLVALVPPDGGGQAVGSQGSRCHVATVHVCRRLRGAG